MADKLQLMEDALISKILAVSLTPEGASPSASPPIINLEDLAKVGCTVGGAGA